MSMVSTLTRKCSHKLRPFFNDTTAVLTQAAERCWPRDRWETKPGCTGMRNVHSSERRQVCASRSGVEPTNKRGNLRHIAEDQAAVHAALDQINNVDLCHTGEILHHRFPEVPQGRSFVRSALAYSKSAAQLPGPV